MRSFLVCLVICLLTSSCGYQVSSPLSSFRGKRIGVPYVEGDQDGDFTSSLIRSLSRSGAIVASPSCADYLLCVEKVNSKEKHVGFRYDKKESGERTDHLIPTETRHSILVKIRLVDTRSGCVAKGPVCLSATLDFDHDYYTSRDGVNVLSLGQLTDIDAARDASLKPIHQMLAQKIVDYLNCDW